MGYVIVHEQLKMDPTGNGLYPSCGKRRDRIKTLLHEHDGFVFLYMRLYHSGEDELQIIILYGYTQTRGRYNVGTFLSGFEGDLETNAYRGYKKVVGIKRCC